MSLNKNQPHLLVLPEDDANRQIFNGFINHLSVNSSAIKGLPIANGWKKAVDQLMNDYAHKMRKFPHAMIVLIIDFDKDENRFSYVESKIPDDLKERVFVLGTQSNPENLRKATKKSFEELGKALAKDCSDNTNELWVHELLKHNKNELDRMILSVKPFLFQ